MADTKVSDETEATTPTGAELVRIVQGGSSKQTTLAVAGHQFRGARARMTTDDTTQNLTGGVDMSFDVADFDTDSFWSAGAPTRLTIPAGLGITHVELVGQMSLSSSNVDTFLTAGIIHWSSAAAVLRNIRMLGVEMGGGSKALIAGTGPLDVADGDYFTFRVQEESDNSVTIEGDQTTQTFLALHVIGMEPI